jgi:uncharacterized membrane protein YidH (DUF202 family)
VAEEGFVYRTRLAWMRTAVTFLGAGLLSARLFVVDAASGRIWLAIEVLLLVLTVTAALGYRIRNRGQTASTDHVLLTQCVGLVGSAALAMAGLLVE